MLRTPFSSIAALLGSGRNNSNNTNNNNNDNNNNNSNNPSTSTSTSHGDAVVVSGRKLGHCGDGRNCTPPMQCPNWSGRKEGLGDSNRTPADGDGGDGGGGKTSSGKQRRTSALGRRRDPRPYPPSPTKRGRMLGEGSGQHISGRTARRFSKSTENLLELELSTGESDIDDGLNFHAQSTTFHSVDSSPWHDEGGRRRRRRGEEEEDCQNPLDHDDLANQTDFSDPPPSSDYGDDEDDDFENERHCSTTNIPKFNLSVREERQVLLDYARIHGSLEIHLRPLPTLFARLPVKGNTNNHNHNYQSTLHPDLDGGMRCKLVSWLAEVCLHFRLAPPTWYLAVYYLDRYLSVGYIYPHYHHQQHHHQKQQQHHHQQQHQPIEDDHEESENRDWNGRIMVGEGEDSEEAKSKLGVPRSRLQLIGMACLYVAAKVEEIYPPGLKEFCQIFGGGDGDGDGDTEDECDENGQDECDDDDDDHSPSKDNGPFCRPSDLAAVELDVLMGLRWHLNVATPYHWVGCYLSQLEAIITLRKCSFHSDRDVLLSFDPRISREEGSDIDDNDGDGGDDCDFKLRQQAIFDAALKMISVVMHLPQSLWFTYSHMAAAALLLCLQNDHLVYQISGYRSADLTTCAGWMCQTYQRVVVVGTDDHHHPPEETLDRLLRECYGH